MHDIETDDAGEVQPENGDFKMASSRRTAVQLLDFLLKTDLGGYAPQPMAGANFGEFIGAHNIARTHNLMTQNAYEAMRFQGVFTQADVFLRIEPIGIYEAAVLAQMSLGFVLSEDEDDNEGILLAYRFQYPDGAIELVDLAESE